MKNKKKEQRRLKAAPQSIEETLTQLRGKQLLQQLDTLAKAYRTDVVLCTSTGEIDGCDKEKRSQFMRDRAWLDSEPYGFIIMAWESELRKAKGYKYALSFRLRPLRDDDELKLRLLTSLHNYLGREWGFPDQELELVIH